MNILNKTKVESRAQALAHINCGDYYAVERRANEIQKNIQVRIIKCFYVHGNQRDSIAMLLDGSDFQFTSWSPTKNFALSIWPSNNTVDFFHNLDSLVGDSEILTFISYSGIFSDEKNDSTPIFYFSFAEKNGYIRSVKNIFISEQSTSDSEPTENNMFVSNTRLRTKTIRKLKEHNFKYGYVRRKNLSNPTDPRGFIETYYNALSNGHCYLYHQTDFKVDQETIEKICDEVADETENDLLMHTVVAYIEKKPDEQRDTIPLCVFSFDDGVLPSKMFEKTARKRMDVLIHINKN